MSQAQQEIFYYRHADERMAFDVQLFEPATGPRSLTTVDTGAVAGHLSFSLGLWTSYASRPWVYDQFVNGSRVATQPLVGMLSQTELHASLGLFEYFELGLALPFVFNSHVDLQNQASVDALGSSMPALVSDPHLGDLRAYVKIPILRGAWQLAARVGVSFPTHESNAFAGSLSYTWTPALVLSRAFGPVTLAANAGYRFRERNGLGSGYEDFVLDDEIVWGAGARWNIIRRFAVNAELIGRIGVSAGAPAANRTPVEGLISGQLNVNDSIGIQLGAGRGFSAGYGTPEFRVFAGVRYTVTRASCTSGPEDYDGFQDGDYCADVDNDQDNILDAADRCANDAEDRDGFLDDDGCPDPDNDADGVLDDADRCPIVPEDHDGYEDTDGCPEGDNDHDNVADAVDSCPMEPEDPDNYQDEDGCPEPGPEAVVVTRTESHLLLSQRVFFDYDSDTIRSVSLPILSEVARTLRANPDITRVRIEGYTDAHGDPQYNLDLSYRRARAVVEYLISQGVAREHLDFQGYGSAHAVADDSTPEGQALNRRVEFTIVAQAGQQSSRAPAGGGTGGTGGTPPPRRRHRGH